MPTETTSTLIPALVGGSIGVVVGQVLSILTTYLTDRRKYRAEHKKILMLRKIKIGEKYFELNGVAIQTFKKKLHHLEISQQILSQQAKEFLAVSLASKAKYAQLISERDKVYTAVNLYYDLESTFESVQDFENKFSENTAKMLDIENSTNPRKDELLIELNEKNIELYKTTIAAMERDRKKIATEIKTYLNKYLE